MNILETQRVSIIVTKSCTLKCKLCGAIAPYIKNYNPSIDFLKQQIAAFFRIVYRTEVVDISGGEPLLCEKENNSSLAGVLDFLCESYADKFQRIRIFTNGTIIPSDKLCEKFASLNKPLNVTIDNYGEHSSKLSGIGAKLNQFGIDHVIRDYASNLHCNGWVDLRDTAKKHDAADAEALYNRCSIPKKLGCCFELLDGIMSPCSVAAARYICGEIEKDSDDIIDLFADTALMREKTKKLLDASMFDSCAHCNGGVSDDSKRFIPAEQATLDEIQNWRSSHIMRM